MNDRVSAGTLGDLVVRAALIEARRHRVAGASAAEAAARVCRGAWAPYRGIVERRLRDEPSAPDNEAGRTRPRRLSSGLARVMVAVA